MLGAPRYQQFSGFLLYDDARNRLGGIGRSVILDFYNPYLAVAFYPILAALLGDGAA